MQDEERKLKSKDILNESLQDKQWSKDQKIAVNLQRRNYLEFEEFQLKHFRNK